MTKGSLPPIDFKALGQALLTQAETLVPQWLPGGARRGPEYVCASLTTSSRRSFSVNLKTGQWADFAADLKGGDLVSLYQAIHDLSPVEAARELADHHGLQDVARIVKRGDTAPPRPPPPPAAPAPVGPSRDRETWTPVVPVPATALQPTFWHHERKNPVHKAPYRSGDALYGYVVRFIDSAGDKVTMPYVWASSNRDGSQKWVWRGWEEPRPLFFADGHPPGDRTVVLVEGEIKGEVLQQLLDAGAPGVYCVASWPNGSKSWRKADWSWLAGTTVLLWPDCDSKREQLTKAEKLACGEDEAAIAAAQLAKPYLAAEKQPGLSAMLGIGAVLRDLHACAVSLLPCDPPGVKPDGWDARDAIETDGWTYTDVQAYFARAVVLATPAAEPPPPKNAREAPAGAGGGDDGDGGRPWWLRPYWDADKGRWLVSRKLVIAALTHDEALQGVLGLNLLSNNIEARQAWPWKYGKPGPITGAVDLLLGLYLSKTYGLPSINRAALAEAIETVAHENQWHPVRDYLVSLPPQRGRGLIDKWLLIVIGESPDSIPAPLFEYLQLVGRYWLLGMVNRVMEPGCQFDYCPVLEGKGGLRKTTMVKMLATIPWFGNTHFEIGRGKEGQEQVQGLWVYELAELANFSKSDINLIKAFISATVDRYRPSYGRVVEVFHRQCVMVGTTNERTYLRDRTGNRRFWPIPVRHVINIEWLLRHRDELFAEAYALYQQGAQFFPDGATEERLFVPMQEQRLVETAVMSELLHVLTRPPTSTGIGSQVNGLTTFVTLSQLTTALGVDAAKSNAALEGQIKSWMEEQGWERKKKQVNGVRAWGYEAPRIWPPREGDEAAPPPAAPPSAGPPPAPENPYDGDADDAPF